VYTIAAAFIYLFLQLPICGGQKITNDPISFLRPVFGAERATLLEFGVFPIISSGLLVQLLAGVKLIKVNLSQKSDRTLFQSLQKVFAIFQYFLLTNIFLATGYFGYGLSVSQIILINLQLVGAGAFVTLIAECVDKGYGFGSGAMIFIVVNIATNFVADIVGINSVQTSRGLESQGAVITLISNIRSKPFTNAIYDSFTRSNLPNLTQTYITVATVLVAVYLQNFRIDLPIRSNRVRSVSNVYPIRLLYTGALPLLYSYVAIFYLNIIGYTIVNLGFKNNADHPIVKILGHYTSSPFTNTFAVESPSIIYFLSPSSSLAQSLTHPVKTIVFAAIIIATSAVFANIWCMISGSAPRDIANSFKEQGISLAGRRDISISKELSRVIPIAAVSGATCLALISVVGEIFGSNGKSAAIVVAVATVFSFLELIATEYQQAGGSQNFGQFFSQLQ
jgi:protein transport protein SEC61 subunit alpha